MSKERKHSEVRLPAIITRALLRVRAQLEGLARRLSRWSSGCPPKRLKVLLVLFCLPFFAESLSIFYSALQRKARLPFSVSRVQVVPLEQAGRPDPPAEDPALLRVHRFAGFLDSLGGTATGAARRDSFLHARPGLLDSLRFLDSLYLSTQKNP
jgi:hypothetical protein